MAAPIIFLDANVLYSAPLRDLLVQLGLSGVTVPRWSDAVNDEWMAALSRQRPDLDGVRLERTSELMEAALPQARVTDFEPLIEKISLPDPDDRHVVAAAVTGDAKLILTFNLKDFPVETLEAHGLAAVHPDQFLPLLLQLTEDRFAEAVRAVRARLRQGPPTVEFYLTTIAKIGLPRLALALSKIESAL